MRPASEYVGCLSRSMPSTVVAMRRPRVGVASSILHMVERGAGVERELTNAWRRL